MRILSYLLISATAASVALAGETTSAPSAATPWWEWDNATGDWFGVRATLADRGVDISGEYLAEVWGNTTGGQQTGAVYTGLLQFGTTVDLEKLVGWRGATFNTTWLWLSGKDISGEDVGNFLTVSNIAGFNTFRALDIWLEQELFDDKLAIRVGQMTADSEFVISDYGSLFLNGTFGWPAFLYTNVPEGGPGYPMGTLGVRVAYHPFDWATVQSAVFQGNVFAQNVNRHGFRWDLNAKEGYFWINEFQGRWNHSDESAGLPGQAKLGAWFQTGDTSDPYFDNAGIPLADEGASEDPLKRPWNFGVYGIVDQMLFREASSEIAGKDAKSTVAAPPSDQGLGWFGRIALQPQNRNFVGFYFDTGVTYTGLIPTRDADQIGIAFAYAQLTNGARQNLDLEGSQGVGAEMVVEFTYQAAITPWLSIQPDAQIIINPGGTQDFGNAFVIGARATVVF